MLHHVKPVVGVFGDHHKVHLKVLVNCSSRPVSRAASRLNLAGARQRISFRAAAADSSRDGNLVATVQVAESVPSSSNASLTDQHLFILGVMASVIMGALSCMFLAAIPALLAVKRAAKSVEELANTTRAELPGTMAAVRLSGMEISDLTMELSDLGQEITAGVRKSTRAVRAAEDGLRRMGNLATSAGADEYSDAAAGGSQRQDHPGADSGGQDSSQEPGAA